MESEITPYVQIVLGFIGIALNLRLIPDFVGQKIVESQESQKQGSLATVALGIRLFASYFATVACAFLVALGLTLLLAGIAGPLGAQSPLLVAGLGVASLICLAFSLVYLALGNRYWILAVPTSVGLGLLSAMAALAEDMSALSILAIMMFLGFVGGLVSLSFDE